MDTQESQTVEEVTVSQSPAGATQTQTVTRKGMSVSDFFVSKTNQIIFAFIGIIDLLLLVRVVFLLLGGNQVGIVSFVMSITDLFVAPFRGIFPSPSSGDSYLDVAAIVAMVIYVVFGFILGVIIDLFSSKSE
jgi:uncharacterized protein YggT (Ycf19 family)